MTDTFRLHGELACTPARSVSSLEAEVLALLDESLYLAEKLVTVVELDGDAPVSVQFGSLAGANVVLLRATGGKVRARVTSADGSAQAIPVDPLLIQISQAVPVTAIDLTRLAGIVTTVQVFLGEL